MRVRSFRTSGTTGRPKEFEVNEELMRARVRRLTDTNSKGAEFAGLRSLYFTLSLTSTLGTRYRIWAIEKGVRFFTDPPPDDVEIDGAIGSPASLLRSVGNGRRYRYIMSSGAPLLPDAARLIREAMLEPGGVFYVSYGASEVGSISLGTAEQAEAVSGCVGHVLPDAEVQIIDGRVRVRTPTMVPSQVREDGWFYPGDVGRFHSDGTLVLTGRA